MASFVSRVPRAPLDRFVGSIWANERSALPYARERLLPTGNADIVVALGSASIRRFTDELDGDATSFAVGLVSGPMDRPTFRDTSTASSVVGIHFRPGGLAAFVREPIDRLTSGPFGFDDVFGRFATELRDRLGSIESPAARLDELECALLARLGGVEASDPVVEWAIGRLERDPIGTSIGSLQEQSGFAASTFVERFRRIVGFSPKRFARVLRMNRAVAKLSRRSTASGTIPFARFAIDCGFSDQAHFVREMRALTGLTPTSYRPTDDQPNHVPVSERSEEIFKTRRVERR